MELTATHIDSRQIRQAFPILSREVNGKPLVYFDNAASTQMPKKVLDRIIKYQEYEHSNVHRGIHTLSQQATDAYEAVRSNILSYLNAGEAYEAIFTSGTTAAINLVAHSWGRSNLKKGDVILVSEMEHHANMVPWQMIAAELGTEVWPIPITDDGELNLDAYENLLDERVKVVCLNYVSNTLGTINDVEKVITKAHEFGALTMIDGAQAMSHFKLDVASLKPDFFAFSAHKLFGPTGTGALVARRDLLEAMPPFMGGGDMIKKVSFNGTTFNEVPYRFEAGTPAIMPVLGMGAALDFIQEIGLQEIAIRETELLKYLTARISEIDEVKIIGTAPSKVAIVSFVVDGVHPHDVGTFLDQDGIAIRVGHHCTQPIMQRFNIPATSRASLAFYNTEDEIDTFIESLKSTITLLN